MSVQDIRDVLAFGLIGLGLIWVIVLVAVVMRGLAWAL